jgi:hypothetical protein
MSNPNVITLKSGTKAAVVVEFGQNDGNPAPDVTVSAHGSVPFTGGGFRQIVALGPFNAPLDQAQTLANAAVAAIPLPPPAKAVAAGVVTGVFAMLRLVM